MIGDAPGDFIDAMRSHGILLNEPLKADGKLHRFRCGSARKSEGRNCFYVLHPNGVPAGAFGCWKRGIKVTWRANGHRLTADERRMLNAKVTEDRKAREREERERHQLAAKRAQTILAKSAEAPADHPYLAKKRVQPHGLKVDHVDRLLVPMRDADGKVWSLQTIAEDGAKLFLKGGRTAGLFHLIGEPGPELVIAEGFATAATIREATGLPVVVAFNCGNLPAVVKAIRQWQPMAHLAIAADDDWKTDGNPGLTKAQTAAELVGASIAVPVFPEGEERGTDFNDMANHEAVAEIIRTAFEPSEEGDEPEASPQPPPEGEGEAEKDPRLPVYLSPKRINVTLRTCAQLLRDDVFMRGPVATTLVRVEEAGGKEVKDGVLLDGVRHAKGSPILTSPSPALIQFRLDEAAAFWRFDKRENAWLQTSCQRDLASRVIDAATELAFRPCGGIVAVPLFQDGQIIATPGYHASTGAILAFDGELPAIPEHPTKAEAERALDVLLRPFRGYFNRQDAELRAGFAAAALTAVVRPSLPAAPAIVFDANVPGAGKGKAARALSAIATGRLPSIITEGPGNEEVEKRLAAAVLSGTPVLLLDNLQRTLASSTLESGLTEGVATIRIFGKLTDVTVPCSALVLVTANNAALRADMLRRILPIRIVVQTDTPEKRRFTFDPYTEAKRGRLAIIAAALTILRAWWLARDTEEGCRIRRTTLGSFEDWADLVAGAVEWLTGLNPITLIENRKNEDSTRSDEIRLISAIFAWRGETAWKAKDAVDPDKGVDLDLWEAALGPREKGINAQNAGYWLRRRKDRVFGNLQLVGDPDRKGVAQWKVLQVPGMPGIAGDDSIAAREMAEETKNGRNGKKSSFCHADEAGGIIPGNARHPLQDDDDDGVLI